MQEHHHHHNNNNHISKKRKIQQQTKTKNNDDNTKKSSVVKLYCPAASKTSEVVAWEDQRLDIGIIARIFGIEPATLKLNGHFISRGIDLVASSVTWRSLLSFFSSKGLSTGAHISSALLVDGKLVNCGSKRQHDPEANSPINGACRDGMKVAQAPHTEVINSSNNKKLKGNNNANEMENKTASSDAGVKRKNWLENVSPLIKRARIGATCSTEFCRGLEEREGCTAKLRCNENLCDRFKRTREDEVIASSCKRTR